MLTKKQYAEHFVRPDGVQSKKLTENTPLTPVEQKFIQCYIQTAKPLQALRAAGYKTESTDNCREAALRMLARPNVQAEIKRIMEEIRSDTIAEAKEVMEYFTKVMRGEEKDQFGLEAPLSERTKAAQELAKRTIDIENRATKADQTIEIQLDWKR